MLFLLCTICLILYNLLLFSQKAKGFVNDGFLDAIKHYDDKDTTLDKAVDALQKDVRQCIYSVLF